jgi:hypothetical protein
MSAESLGHDSPSCAPTRWRRMQALNGHGQMLIGPDEHRIGHGAMVIAPPGVLLRAPEGGEPLTREGWREARWRPDEDGIVLVDQARPSSLAVVGLAQIVEDLAEWAPEQLIWVAAIVERQMRVLIGRMTRDCHGAFHPRAGTAYNELMVTTRGGDEAFARLREYPGDFPDWMVDRHFSRMQLQLVADLNEDRERHQKMMRAAARDGSSGGRRLKLVTEADNTLRRDDRLSD